MRKCKINIEDKDYTLYLNRKSIMWLEQNGFTAEMTVQKPISAFNLMFEAGFKAEYPTLNASELMEKYQDEGGDVEEVVQFLIEEYGAFITALTDTKSSKKKMEII